MDRERDYYVVCLNLIEREWAANRIGRVRELLEATRSNPNRGFEWGYWNRQSQREQHTIAVPGLPLAVAFSPDGKRLLTTSSGNGARLWEAQTGKELAVFRKTGQQLYHGAFSQDSSRAATVTVEGTVALWDARTGALLKEWKDTQARVGLAFAPEGNRLATVGLDGWVRLWELSSGKELLAARQDSGSLYCVAFSPDGTRFVTGSDDTTAVVRDTETGKTVLTLKGHKGQLNTVSYSPEGTRLLTSSRDGTARVWDAQTGKCLFTIAGHVGEVWCAAFSPSTKQIATAGQDTTVRIWHAETGKELDQLKGHTEAVRSLSFAARGAQLASVGSDSTLKLWEIPPLPSPRPTPALRGEKLPFKLTSRFIGPRVYSEDSALVAQRDGVWEIDSGKPLLAFPVTDAQTMRALAFSQERRWLLSGHSDGTTVLWDLRLGKEVRRFPKHGKEIRAVAFFPDSTRFITGSDDSTGQIWERTTGNVLQTLSAHTKGIHSVAVYLNGQRIATGSDDNTVRLWDDSGKPLSTFEGKTMTATALTFSAEGELMLTRSPSCTAWELPSGKRLKKLHPERGGPLYLATFSPDGKRLATADQEGHVVLWDSATLQELLTIPSRERLLNELTFSSDGKHLKARALGGFLQEWHAD